VACGCDNLVAVGMGQQLGEERRSHFDALDSLRALAISLVLASHATDDFPRLLQKYSAAGWCGVDLFFVLSGFLITRGLLKSKASDEPYFRLFYWKRFLRIFPLYYAALLLFFFVLPVALPLPVPSHADQKWYFLYLSNWPVLAHQSVPIVGHFWSLAVEEQFYLMWPLLVFLLPRRGVIWGSLLAICAAPLVRSLLLFHGVDQELIYRNTFCRMDALMAGALGATLFDDPRFQAALRRWRMIILPLSLGLVISPVLLWGPSYFRARVLVGGISMYVLGFSLAVASGAVRGTWWNRFNWKPLKYIARWSYGIYVYHLLFYWWAHQIPGLAGFPRIALEVGVSVLIAALSYEFFESKLLRFKDLLRHPRRRLAGIERSSVGAQVD